MTKKERVTMDYTECPCCGSRLVMMGQDLVTLEEAQDEEMDARIEREWDKTATATDAGGYDRNGPVPRMEEPDHDGG